MEILKMKLYSNDVLQKTFDFSKKWTVITSNNKNSQGKTTIIRSILYGMGLIKKDNFVDGTHVKEFMVKIYFDNGFCMIRYKEKLIIKKEGYNKIFLCRNTSDYEKILNEYKYILGNDWEFINAFLFANYSDQQYGSDVINHGKTGPFPHRLEFSIDKLTESLDADYVTLSVLRKERKKLIHYSRDIDFIKKNVEIQSNNLKMDFDEVISTSQKIKTLKLKINSMKFLANEYGDRLNALAAFESNVMSLGLIYQDDQGRDKKLTIDNFDKNINIQKNVIQEKINQLNYQLEEAIYKMNKLNSYIDEESLIDEQNIKNIKTNIIANRVKISESNFSSLLKQKEKIEKNIKKMENKVTLNKLDFISFKIDDNLKAFSMVNPDIKKWIKKHQGNQYKVLLDKDSKFNTYVGAIRFIITTSFKFAISSYLWEKGIKFPIIIDNLFPEELDEKVRGVYMDLLYKLPQRKIIAEINQDFLKIKKINPSDINRITVEKNNFKENQINLFSTIE
ncbi:MAG: hypothetical protein HRT98_02350 [Mycoplasmatales bacterium]|nr:hypothetical protein [Mycoplasmatales bacterium]